MEQKEKEEKFEQEQDTIQTETTQKESETVVNEAAEEKMNNEEHRRKSRRKRSERQCEELNNKVEEMGTKLAEMNDKYMRIYSEYENYRKRTSAEKASLILNGGKDVIKLMLPVIDDMERALANMGDDNTAKEGMQLILKNMMNALQQKGLKPMEALGVKFDENYHEAITQIPAPAPEAKGTVIDVVKKGYFLNDEVLRFAQVVVAN
ncbi:MAG: nucleotide exchange factor GrpE [Bacteroidales bacterium]|nr:nucleotide exchange factor GrpE [Bacteroidales bacterium]